MRKSDDTISRRVAINALESIGSIDTEADREYARSVFEALPSADRPKGEWIGEADGYSDGELVYDTWYCSNCDYAVDDEEYPTWNYCPNCGSYNGGGQSEND